LFIGVFAPCLQLPLQVPHRSLVEDLLRIALVFSVGLPPAARAGSRHVSGSPGEG